MENESGGAGRPATGRLDRRFIKEIDGKEFVIYGGLLDVAHQMGLERIRVEILQYPSEQNGQTCIVQASAESDGHQFMDVGDANPSNCSTKVAKHLIRMASTRAKARCLRDFTNIGMTCFEELADFSEAAENGGAGSIGPRRRGRPRTTDAAGQTAPEPRAQAQRPAPQAPPPPPPQPQRVAPPKMSDAQRRAILNLAGRRRISEEDLNALAEQTFGSSFDSLTSASASQMIRRLQQAA